MGHKAKMLFVVCIMETNKEYGGPEEGGWWYNSGEPYAPLLWMTKTFDNYEDAKVYQDTLRDVANTINKDEKRRPTSSMACDGWLEPMIWENEFPAQFPKERPHYE